MLRDTFYIKLKLKGYNFFNRDKVIILEGLEATIEETLEFIEKTEKADFEIIEFLYNFFEKCSKWKINKKIFSKYIANNLTEIIEILKKTYIKGVFEEGKTEIKPENDEFSYKMDKEDILVSFGRLLAFLTEKMSIDPNGILRTYTWRQINFRTQHYLYLEREKSLEGQKINKREDNKRKIDKNRAEIDEELKKIENYLNKKT